VAAASSSRASRASATSIRPSGESPKRASATVDAVEVAIDDVVVDAGTRSGASMDVDVDEVPIAAVPIAAATAVAGAVIAVTASMAVVSVLHASLESPEKP